jgi:hypothetical protein
VIDFFAANKSRILLDKAEVTGYCCCVMATQSVVTKQTPGVRRGLFHRDSLFEKDDATFIVFCLNASMGTAAYDRLVSLRCDLEEFRMKTIERQRVRTALDKELRGPAGPKTQKCSELGVQHSYLLGFLDRRYHEISDRLARYVCRPGIAYTAVGGECRSGVVALPRHNVTVIRTGSFPITESDAALALVRLHATGDLSKVRLCETCGKRWRVAAHSNYRFCSKECREKFYESQPDYLERKKKNQRKYRNNLKLKQAAEDAANAWYFKSAGKPHQPKEGRRSHGTRKR